MFDRTQMQRVREGLRKGVPRELEREMQKQLPKLGRYGVQVARTLVAQDTGETARLISHEVLTRRSAYGGRDYSVRIFIDTSNKAEAIRSFVIEFGRGQGRSGAAARGTLSPRPYLRPSRELVAKRARGAISGAMRRAARLAIETGSQGTNLN